MKKFLFLLLLLAVHSLKAGDKKEYDFTFPVLKFGGGGDWYSVTRAVKNFIRQASRLTDISIAPEPKIINIMDNDFFLYPFIFINGHDDIKFTGDEIIRLKRYLMNGGFIFCNDDYGLYESFKNEMKRVFPDKDFVLVPFSHPIYHTKYEFPEGLPKIHEHFPGPPKGLGIFYENRLVVFFAYNSDIGDGWETEDVYNDPSEKRDAAVKMGINIIYYSMMY